MRDYLVPKDGMINWQALGPFIRLGATIITAIGIIVLLLSVIYAGIRTIKMLNGKKKFGKEEIKKTIILIVVGLLLIGGGWISILKTANRTLIKPSMDMSGIKF